MPQVNSIGWTMESNRFDQRRSGAGMKLRDREKGARCGGNPLAAGPGPNDNERPN